MSAQGLGIIAFLNLGFQAGGGRFSFFQTRVITNIGTTVAVDTTTRHAIALTGKTTRAAVLGHHRRQSGSIGRGHALVERGNFGTAGRGKK